MLMRQMLLPIVVVLAAILSLLLYPVIKGDKSMNEPAAGKPTVVIETTMGNITIELDTEHAPVTSENFLAYVDDGYYVGTIFHRVIPGFMIQGGGLTADMRDKPSKRAPIRNEANNGLRNDRGTVAMARTGEPHSATSQFFINHKDNDFLNFTAETPQGWGYAVFGKVVEGMDVADKIAKTPTGPGGPFPKDVPHQAVIIEKATIVGK